MCNAGKITLAGVSRVAFIVQLDVHGRYADCCLTVHGPGLLDNESLFLEQQREKRGEKWKRQYEESLGIKQREREQEVGEEERKKEKKKKKIALTIMQHGDTRGKMGKCYGQPSN